MRGFAQYLPDVAFDPVVNQGERFLRGLEIRMQSPELVGPRFGLIGFVLVRLDIAAFEEEDQRARYRSLLGAHGKDVQRHPLARLIERDRHCVRQGGLELRRVADLVDRHVGDVVEDFRQRARVLGREMHDHPVSKVEVAGQFAEQRLERLHPAGRGAYPANRRGLRACVFSRVFRRVLGRVRAGPVALLVGQRFFPWRKVLHGPPPHVPVKRLFWHFLKKGPGHRISFAPQFRRSLTRCSPTESEPEFAEKLVGCDVGICSFVMRG